MNNTRNGSVLIIHQYYYPELAAASHMATDLAEGLSKKGKSVTVIAGNPGDSATSYENLAKETVLNGVRVIRVSNTYINKRLSFTRMLNWLSFYFMAFLKSMTLPKHDIVITLTNPPLTALIGGVLKFVKKARFVYWVQDLYPDVAIKIGALNDGVIAKIIDKISISMIRYADDVVVLGESMKEYVVSKGCSGNNITVIPNWEDEKRIYPIHKDENKLLNKYNPDGKFIVMYSGNMGMAHDFETIKEAIEKLAGQPDILFLFIGDGVQKKGLEAYIKKNNFKNIRFLPYVSHEELVYILNVSDLFLLSMKNEVKGVLVPTKIYDYLAVGKPTIAICPSECEIWKIINDHRCGFLVDESNIHLKILELYKDRNLREEMGKSGRAAFLKSYTKTIAVERFFNLFYS